MKETNNELNEVWLTTFDNPFNPFENFDAWYNFDEQKHYCTCGLVARLSNVSTEMSQADYYLGLEEAINNIIAIDPIGLYKKVYKNKNESLL